MVRRKVEIKRIEEKSKRHTTFTKRRKSLFKKIEDFSKKSDSEAAIIAFSKAGNGFVFGHPSANAVLSRYASGSDSSSPEGRNANANSRADVSRNNFLGDGTELTEVEKTILALLESGGKSTLENFGLGELSELENAMKEIKAKVFERIQEIMQSEDATEKSEP